MNDIDFEELDRQISSLSAKTGDDKTQANPPQAAPAPSTGPTNTAPTQPSPAPEQQPSVAPAPSSQQPVKRGPSGRFMDVVHPSSDMRSAPPVQPRPSTPTPPPASAVPQPSPAPIPASNPNPTPIAQPNPQPQANSEPQSSPFLPDAKVEKRPLGNPAPPQAPGMPLQKEDASKPPAAPLPPELNDELLSVETGDETMSQQKQPEQPTDGSVLQKHVDESAKPEDNPAPVFNAEPHKQPKKKSKSGWITLLWIILLIVLGAGAGAAIYFYVLPLL